MKLNVSELDGALLDLAVAKADGWTLQVDIWSHPDGRALRFYEPHLHFIAPGVIAAPIAPSRNWSDGGPIIERERICIERCQGTWSARIADDDDWFKAAHQSGRPIEDGPTPLIAAMRAYVVSKFGDEVELP